MDQRYIENNFPVSEVSGTYRIREISSLHKWWARSSLESSSAIIYSSLISSSDDKKIRDSIVKLAGMDGTGITHIALKNISKIFENPPKVLDPYAGGGSIPFEALRLDCETYANEYNPVAVLIEKCLLEYPQKFGPKLSKDFLKWMDWVYSEVKDEVGKFYSSEDNTFITSYLWAKTIPCQNPACGAEIPLMRTLWLVNKKNKKIALVPQVKNGEVEFEIKEGDGIPQDFDPGKGTVNRAIAECLVCGTTIESKTTRKLFQEGHSGNRMVAVTFNEMSSRSKRYRIPEKKDTNLFEEAKESLNLKIEQVTEKLGINPLPDEPIPQGKGMIARSLYVGNYGFETWGDLFNPRQQLIMVTFVEKINKAYKKMLSEGLDKDYSKALVSYLTLNLGRLMHVYSGMARWNPRVENVRDLFGRPAISLRWECGEINPFIGEMKYSDKIADSISDASKISDNICHITQSSATNIPHNNDYFDAVFADPPFYDNIPYSYLSDFFYVWFKRTLGSLYPDLFLTPLTPKNDEIISQVVGESTESPSEYFENKLKKSFQEIYRVLKPDGIFVVGYTYKTTKGWEMVIQSLLECGFIVTASWPIVSTMKNRLRSQNAAAISTSIYIVARKSDKIDLGWLKEVNSEIKEELPKKIDNLLNEGIKGSDFFIAGLGFGLGIYSKYQRILDNQGNEVSLKKQWNYIRNFITDYIINSVLGFETSTNLKSRTKFYILWRWIYQDSKLKFDEAQKLARSVGLSLSNNQIQGFIVKNKDIIYLKGPDERSPQSIENSKQLVDVLHYLCLLWKQGKKDEIKTTLEKNDANKIFIVAQTLSKILPNENPEKMLIEGFLASTQSIN